jgi:PAS domain S-box-containing protein
MVPVGPVISFGKAVLEHEHRLLILSAIAALSFQAAIIITMLIHDRRRRQVEQSLRRKAEQSLKESEERMAFAAASTRTGFWQIETADWSLWTTDQCRTLFGFAADARLTLETLLERVHQEDRGIFAQTMRTAVEFRRPIEFEFRVIRSDGEICWITARGQPREGDEGGSASLSGVFTDVTALKNAESDAEMQRRQVAHLMRQSMLGELSGAIAHELNQPLTAILSNAETAQDLLNRKDVDLDQVRDILKDIVDDNNRAGEVIRRLRKLLRKGESKAEPINLNQLVESTLGLLRGELVRRGINVKIALAADVPASVGDSVQLQQVLLNLIMNAMEAMNEKPSSQRELIITTRATGEQIEAVIADRGDGIAPEIEKRLFQPFFTTREFGLGLGLSICSTIVQSHGGKLTLRNNAYGGATATFALPTRIAMAPA